MISPAIEGMASGTWKAERKAREKAANWGGSRARMHSCRVWTVGGSRGARAALVLVAEERVSAGRGSPSSPIAVASPMGAGRSVADSDHRLGLGRVRPGGRAGGLLAVSGLCRVGVLRAAWGLALVSAPALMVALAYPTAAHSPLALAYRNAAHLLRSPAYPTAAHLPLLLIVKRQAKGIAKGDEGAFHGVGFGLLDCGFMG